MIYTSQLLKMHAELKTFDELAKVVRALGEQGEFLISMDEKPPYPDTPENWELALENEFTWLSRDPKSGES
jgi:hypothetical protein